MMPIKLIKNEAVSRGTYFPMSLALFRESMNQDIANTTAKERRAIPSIILLIDSEGLINAVKPSIINAITAIARIEPITPVINDILFIRALILLV